MNIKASFSPISVLISSTIQPGTGKVLKTGMVLAIEPMVTMGSWEVRILEDPWTAGTMDGSWGAHFEDTIAITDNGPEILTRCAPPA